METPVITSKVELLYSKSKVYIHPSRNAKDHVAGYIAIVRPNDRESGDEYITWVPENVAKNDKQDFDSYVQVDLDNASGKVTSSERKFVKSLLQSRSQYAFSIKVNNIQSIRIRLPSLGWWWGSLIITDKDSVAMPALFFHDSECDSTLAEQNRLNESFQTFNESHDLIWGGELFLTYLRKYIKLSQSPNEPSLLLAGDSCNVKVATSRSKHDIRHERETISWEEAKWGLLSRLAKITRFSRRTSQQILHHTPTTVKSLLNIPEVERLSKDYESARIYIAELAAGLVAENRKNQNNLAWTNDFEQLLDINLGSFDVLNLEHGAQRRNPVTVDEWHSFFDVEGHLRVTSDEVKDRIFHGGLEPEARKSAWPFLLGIYSWDSSASTRATILAGKRNEYFRLKRRWWDDVSLQESDTFWKDQKARIEKDVLRTDRNLEIFGQSDIPHPDPNSRLASTGANPHIELLKDLLITYNEYNENLGYVQGMSDLLSPLYVVLQDDALAFWAFVEFMRRMERNYLRDQSGMRQQLSTLDHLTRLMCPTLYKHLEKADSTHFFFFFRMLLVWYKRELPWDSMLRLWEVLWTDYYSSQFHLFIALAILDLNADVLMANYHYFDEILKFINEIGPSLDIDDVLVRATRLFQKFAKLVASLDHVKSVGTNNPDASFPVITDDLRLLLSRQVLEVKEGARPPDATGG